MSEGTFSHVAAYFIYCMKVHLCLSAILLWNMFFIKNLFLHEKKINNKNDHCFYVII